MFMSVSLTGTIFYPYMFHVISSSTWTNITCRISTYLSHDSSKRMKKMISDQSVQHTHFNNKKNKRDALRKKAKQRALKLTEHWRIHQRTCSGWLNSLLLSHDRWCMLLIWFMQCSYFFRNNFALVHPVRIFCCRSWEVSILWLSTGNCSEVFQLSL